MQRNLWFEGWISTVVINQKYNPIHTFSFINIAPSLNIRSPFASLPYFWMFFFFFFKLQHSKDLNLNKLWEIVEDRGAWQATVHGAAKSWTQLRNWTITTAGNESCFQSCFNFTANCWKLFCPFLSPNFSKFFFKGPC